jgi:hypothetical protein
MHIPFILSSQEPDAGDACASEISSERAICRLAVDAGFVVKGLI